MNTKTIYANVAIQNGEEVYTSFGSDLSEMIRLAWTLNRGVIRIEEAHAGKPPVWTREGGAVKSGPKYPDIEVQLSGEDGNGFMIVGRISTAMRRNGVPQEERETFQREATAGTYDELLQTCMKWVNVQ